MVKGNINGLIFKTLIELQSIIVNIENYDIHSKHKKLILQKSLKSC